jgi:hypothetical protein
MAHREWLWFGLTSTGNVDVEIPEIQINHDNSEHGSFELDRVAGVMVFVPRQIRPTHVNGIWVGRYTGGTGHCCFRNLGDQGTVLG